MNIRCSNRVQLYPNREQPVKDLTSADEILPLRLQDDNVDFMDWPGRYELYVLAGSVRYIVPINKGQAQCLP